MLQFLSLHCGLPGLQLLLRGSIRLPLLIDIPNEIHVVSHHSGVGSLRNKKTKQNEMK